METRMTMKFTIGKRSLQSDNIFDDIIVMLILWHHQNVTAKKVEVFEGSAEYLKNGYTGFHQTLCHV